MALIKLGNDIGAMQHCAFVVTAERFREVEARLKSHRIDYVGPIPQLPGLLRISRSTLKSIPGKNGIHGS